MARIAVIGGGFGGLASAARLAKLGHDITLLERGKHLGGAVSTIGPRASRGSRPDLDAPACRDPGPVPQVGPTPREGARPRPPGRRARALVRGRPTVACAAAHAECSTTRRGASRSAGIPLKPSDRSC
ncbi:FAD-dependent oxidoreductase [Nocardioides cavernaquae]|uniref:FAD-dependent oxidoreductase n=1 Tax=Nocardioides cavernaquae TaxID=2321396 RepID=UPI001EE54C26|nr:FAD-dependent oxidoreductase [Nocardioides cavernaquae]